MNNDERILIELIEINKNIKDIRNFIKDIADIKKEIENNSIFNSLLKFIGNRKE